MLFFFRIRLVSVATVDRTENSEKERKTADR
jgi:hypothetical protein